MVNLGARTPQSPPPEVEETPEVVEGPGEPPAPPPLSWSLSNFAPPQATGGSGAQTSPPIHSPLRTIPKGSRSPSRNNNRISPRLSRSPRNLTKSSPRSRLNNNKNNISSTAPGSNTSASSNTSHNNAESDSCYDSTKEVESVLAKAKNTEVF